jgi:hypothetical protein
MCDPNGALVTELRQHLDAARQAGEPTPGRTELDRLTGVSEHQVRRALANLTTAGVEALDPVPAARAPGLRAVCDPGRTSRSPGSSSRRRSAPHLGYLGHGRCGSSGPVRPWPCGPGGWAWAS